MLFFITMIHIDDKVILYYNDTYRQCYSYYNDTYRQC